MTLLALFSTVAGLPADIIRSIVTAAGNAAPDLKPQADALLAALEQPLGAENLAAVAAALPQELKDILLGHLTPAEHPSDDA